MDKVFQTQMMKTIYLKQELGHRDTSRSPNLQKSLRLKRRGAFRRKNSPIIERKYLVEQDHCRS